MSRVNLLKPDLNLGNYSLKSGLPGYTELFV